MVNIFEKDGIFILEGEDFDLKIDNNRRIYIRRKGANSFDGLGTEIEVGYKPEEKKKYLYNLYIGLRERKSEIIEKEKGTKRKLFG